MTRPLADRLKLIPPSATVGLADIAANLRRQGVEVFDLSAGRAPEPTPAYIVEAAVAAMTSGRTHQTMAVGTPEYRAACAAKLARENAILADPETEIIATMGVKQGLTLALMVTVNPGDEVIVEDPLLCHLPAAHPARRRSPRGSAAALVAALSLESR